ncbi:MAG: AMP-binding protein, partial [Algicola sp.]|nr:AMP-binding protein [Algicola sp.]
ERTSDFQPTSFAQQRLWFIDQMSGSSVQYNMPMALAFNGVFDENVVEQAFSRIIARHEPLRTVFVKSDSDDGVMQHIRAEFEFALTNIDLRGQSAQNQQLAVREAALNDANTPFDLSSDLMLRSTFIRLSAGEGVLLFNMHHIASDGWSMGLMTSEFWSHYLSIKSQFINAGEANPLPALPIQYADYAQWQQQFAKSGALDTQLDYWDQQLADLPQVHALPLDRTRPKEQGFEGAMFEFGTSLDTFKALKKLALDQNATVFMTLHGAFSLLLSRHSNSDDIVMGVPVANRLQKELESVIGFFVNTLVLRADCTNNPTFVDYLAHIKQVNLDAQANQDVPFEQLVERLQPQRSTAFSPLFQIMFAMNNNENSTFELPDLTLKSLAEEDQHQVAKFELTLNAMETEQGLLFAFEYNRSLFDTKTIESLAQHLVCLLDGIVANPHGRIDQLELLSTDEQQRLLGLSRQTNEEAYNQATIVQLFEQQVKRTPDQLAVVFEGQQLSYFALNQQANRLANYLIAQGVKNDTLVGLCVERSVDMVVAMMAILKAGGAYVPLDPGYPQNRLNYMIEDSDIALLLTQTGLLNRIDADIKMVILDEQLFTDYSDENPATAQDHNHNSLAYVIYTSGSTGQPKGVMVEHRGVVNLLSDFA